ncbi:1-deoxy-D-xylulose-5-phosphate reductoisomerase [Petrotoga olearia]|uniref:1-deoxy-D-xylulose 5-phosphate reductoisomerase n=2 Tax=Petrotoga olearia TaxID=156203 RepID=A0A2K1NYC5_9BACT|nr:1-deoxy-D-xylulose-5-phosphate reductoisomerase [Petrotoga olearia]PNR95526.1 1-deoxy-D-xylulose 5-phosphate reductoisomerase [Petrotoga olearia DSM 13574]RMA71365.1 1-deoxy-D-xylulose 5-phosphate reductoisomerase [Petrotoga olearia]
MKSIFIAGISGSIGQQALEVLKKEWFKDNFKIVGGSVYKSWDKLKEAINKYSLKSVGIVESNENISKTFNGCRVFTGVDAVERSMEFCNPDYSLIATSGFSGVQNTLKAIDVSQRVCLANKESIVCGGNYVLDYAAKLKREIIPIDSEHSAIFQLLMGETSTPEKIILTASGGSLRDYPVEALENVSVDEVLNHPVWSMGKRITVDSASMVNKSLELFEAYYLFKIKNIDVAINRNSRIHSMVQFSDGVIKMHYGLADMKIPIAFSISYPERNFVFDKPDFFSENIHFEKVDFDRYPSLKLAYSILGDAPLQNAFNAADEIAVDSFLKGSIKFADIYRTIYKTVNEIQKQFLFSKSLKFHNIDDILKVDKISRNIAKKYIMEVIE